MGIEMRGIVMVIFIFSISCVVKSQSIPIETLITLEKDSLSQVKEYLGLHNWDYESYETHDASKEITWTYKKSGEFNELGNPKALGWVTYCYSDYMPASVIYQYSDYEYYKKVIGKLKLIGFKEVRLIPSAGSLESVYAKGGIEVSVLETKREIGSKSYMYVISNWWGVKGVERDSILDSVPVVKSTR